VFFCQLVRFSSRGGLVILFFLIVSFFSLLTWLMMSSNARGLVADEV
jgi:hypothetical protein